MMMNDIDIIIYSYKGKLVKDVVSSLMTNSTGKRNINIILLDQHPINRAKTFYEFTNLYYNHVFWDLQVSPLFYKKDMLSRSKSKYVMILGDNVLLNKDWDDELVGFVENNNTVISGNKNIKISQDSIFYLTKNFSESDNFSITNFIDRDLVFFDRNKLYNFDYPSYLKYNGEEEVLSLDIFTSGNSIYCSPSNIFTKVGVSTIEDLYVPFSINHNYNEAVDLLVHGSNSFIDLSNKIRSTSEFCNFHGIDVSKINKLPFQTNDVSYDPADMNFNSVDARRFVARTKAIH